MKLPTEFSEVERRLDELEGLLPYRPLLWGRICAEALDAVRTELARALDGMVLIPEEDAMRTPRLPQ